MPHDHQSHRLRGGSALHWGGLTLIEVLAVIVIASFLTATVTVGLASADRGAQMIKAMATIQDMDLRGRLQARTSGGWVKMNFDRDQDRLALTMPDGAPIAVSDPVLDVRMVLEPATIIFDRQGRSDDYQVVIQTDAAARKLNVCGMTGLAQEQAP